jgi:hypothetical protein
VISRRPAWWVVGCGFILSLPVLLAGFPALTHDGRVHEVWYTNFAAQFWAGDLYPRWLQNLDMGLGGPSFYFYPPLPFFITSLFQPLFKSQPHSWHVLGVSVALALILSGVAAYAWLRETMSDRSAAIAAMLYMAMPYHFAVDIHTRGAFGEVWSFLWIALILCCAQRIITRPTFGAALGLTLSYAGLITTHLPTTLIFSVIPPVWVWWMSVPGTRIRNLIWTGAAMALGIGLSAIYLVPAMRDQAFVSMDAMRVGDFHYSKAFFLQRDAQGELVLARNIFERGLFWMGLATAAVGAAAAIVAWRHRAERAARPTIFWSIVAIVSVFMMLPISTPVFELVKTVQLIQFPWRFHAILGLAVIALVGEALGAIESRRDALDVRLLTFGGVLVFQWMLFAVWPLEITSFGDNRHLHGPPSAWKAKNTNTPEYRPRWLTTDIAPVQKRLRGGGDSIAKIALPAGSARITQWKPRDIVVELDAPANERLEVRQFYYPGWTAMLDRKTQIPVTPADTSGVIEIDVPPGAHRIDLRLVAGPSEILGDRISLVCLLVAALVGAAALIESRRRVSASR